MRSLKYHEYKLLKKSDFLQWKRESGRRESAIIRRYYIQRPEDYHKYNKILGKLTKLAHKLLSLPKDDMLRIRITDDLLNKLFDIGLLATKSNLDQVAKLTASAFCRRRLPVMMVRLKYAETMKEAVTLIEQGHIKIGPEIVTDPAIIVTRNMEDFITWADRSKIRRKVLAYNEKLDDYDVM
mmetsp:Transcript_3631/g.6351  ORF Transcript_3631/g.6351 Transcript_3631/m.6351 type:complete len:182 (+) Transcript_3631:83-628(+)